MTPCERDPSADEILRVHLRICATCREEASRYTEQSRVLRGVGRTQMSEPEGPGIWTSLSTRLRQP